MPLYLPPATPFSTGSTCTCMRILTTSSGATATRETPPANAPAIACVKAPTAGRLPCPPDPVPPPAPPGPILACAALRWIPSPDASPAAVPSTASRRARRIPPASREDAPAKPGFGGAPGDAPKVPHAMRVGGETRARRLCTRRLGAP